MARSEDDGASGKHHMETTENPLVCPDETYGITREMIQKHKTLLTDRLQDTEYGILDKLLANDGLTFQEATAIENCSTNPYERSKKLIDEVLEKNILSQFIATLVDTGQKHLVNYLRGDGVWNAEFGDDWPLAEDRIKQLNMNHGNLISIIDPCSGLNGELLSAGVINERQYGFISQERNTINKNKAILNITRRQSVKDYNTTILCLKKSGQSHIAEILEGPGAIQRIRVSQEGDAQIVNPIEDALVDRLTELLRDRSIEEARRILAMTELKIVASKTGESIYLYVYSETLDELMALHNLLITGDMKRIVETLFNKLVLRQDRIVVSCTYSEEEFDKCKTYFEESGSAHSKSFAVSKDIIHQVETTQQEELQTSVTSPFAKASLKGEEPTSVAAASMDTDIRKSRESKVDRPELRQDEIIPAIIRNNMDYFTEHIQPRLLINKLHNLGIIRDERMRHLRSMSYDNEKNYEVLNIIRAASIENYHRFVQCLRETEQNLVADVAGKGGVVFKVKVAHEPAENLDEVQKEIVQKLNQLQDKTIPKSEEVWRFLSQLKRANIEIVSARWDKGVVMWLWCRSQKALGTIDNLNMEFEEFGRKPTETGRKPEYNKFGIALNGLFTLLLSGKGVPEISSVFLDNPDRDVVCQKLFNDFPEEMDARIDVGNERSVCTAAKVDNKIYVLCKNPTTVLVFEDGKLTQPRQELPVDIIIDPMDMAFSRESSCLYITERGIIGVWKVDMLHPKHKVDLWQDAQAGDPFTLSVTNDGHLLMVKRGPPSSLDVYHTDVGLLLRLLLPPPIVMPNHAVETSKGNFIVSYDKPPIFPGGVCEITREGQIISRFDLMFESISGVAEAVNQVLAQIGEKSEFPALKYLAIDDRDQIYACCYKADGVLCLDSRLKMETTIMRKNELKTPYRVQYVKQEEQLMVTDRRLWNVVFILNEKLLFL